MLSFGFNNQGLAQNVSDAQFHSDKIKISAENPPVPSYLRHSKKALKNAELKQKKEKDSLWTAASKMLKALFLSLALFFALIALLVKNKDKFNLKGQTPISLAKAMKQEEPEATTESKADTQNIQPEVISADKQIRNLVFKFFNMNK
jgi:hypothetical protein